MTPAVRTFIALPLAPVVAAQVAEWVAHLRSTQPDGLKWTLPEAWHFTLAFLGAIHQGDLDRVKHCCGLAAGQHEPFTIGLGALGIFPGHGKGRVLWLGLSQGKEEMMSLQQDLAAALLDNGFILEARPFVPHLTLARATLHHDVPRRLNWKGLPGRIAATQRAAGLLVMRSELSAAGAQYTTLSECPLGNQRRPLRME